MAIRRVAAPPGEGMTSSAVNTGQKPPSNVEVVCPSRLPGLPLWADPATAYGDWSQPCDVQLVSSQPPMPFSGVWNCGTVAEPQVCRVLPDGTPLYEYEPSGLTTSTAFDALPANAPKTVQTWFAGVPLDWPPVQASGMPAYTYLPQPDSAVPSGIGSTLYDASPAPYAWTAGSTAPGRAKLSPANLFDDSRAEIYANMNQVDPYPDNVYVPERLVPAPKPSSSLGVDFINSITSFACTAVGSGLNLAGPSVELLGKGTPWLKTANKLGTGFYMKLCGE